MDGKEAVMELNTTVYIFNWNCVKQSQSMVLGVDGTGKLQLSPPVWGEGQLQWVLVPNLITGASYAGYSIVNNVLQQAVEQPAAGQQVTLGDDPTPYGAKSYCWTLFPVGTTPDGHQLWSIQDYQRGPVLDAANSGTSEGTPVIFHGWNGHDNQKWIINPASATSFDSAGSTA